MRCLRNSTVRREIGQLVIKGVFKARVGSGGVNAPEISDCFLKSEGKEVERKK